MAESKPGIISIGSTQSGEDFIRASAPRSSDQAFVSLYSNTFNCNDAAISSDFCSIC